MNSNNECRISVIMSVFNRSAYLCQSIESVLSQTFKDFEFIIIDDGSQDNSLDIIRQFDDPRIKVIRNDKNMGVAASVNKAVKIARGEYIARMDDDDICYPHRLETQLAYMQANPQVDLCFSFADRIDANDNALPPWVADEETLTDFQIKKRLIDGNCLYQPTAFIKTQCFRENLYDESIGRAQDYELWLRLSLIGCVFGKLTVPLIKYRVHNSSITARRKEQSDRYDMLLYTLNLKKTAYRNAYLKTGKVSIPLLLNIWLIRARIFRKSFSQSVG